VASALADRAFGEPVARTYQQVHPWERYTQGFRKEHNVAVTTGSARGVWKIKRFSTIQDKEIPSEALWLKFQYSFHLPLWQGFGYLLGSSAGVLYEQDTKEGLKPGLAWHLPGLLVGVVYNYSPSFRVVLAEEIFLERMENLEARPPENPASLDANMLSLLDVSLSVDYFFSLHLGVRLDAHYRKIFYTAPENAYEERLPEGVSFEKQDRWLGLGIVYHFL